MPVMPKLLEKLLIVIVRSRMPGSVAIDNGTNTLCPSRDVRNFSRPYDGDANGVAICDVGAVEFRPQLLFSNGFE